MGMRFPKSVAEDLRIAPGSLLELTVDGDEIRLRPLRRTSRQLLGKIVHEARRLGPDYQPETVHWGP